MWRFISCFVSKWFTAGKIINTPGLYSEIQIHHKYCIARSLKLKRQYLLRWGHMISSTNHTTIPVCEKIKNYVKILRCTTTRWIIWEKQHLMMFFRDHKEEIIFTGAEVFFFSFFLFSCKNDHKYECFRLELVNRQWPTLEIEISPVFGLRHEGRCFCGNWGPQPPHTFNLGSSSWWNARDS